MRRTLVLLVLAGCSQAAPEPPATQEATPAPAAGFDLRIVRRFDVATADLAAPPAAGTVDGDYLDYGGGCGYLYKSAPREAIAIVCDGQLAAGPITDVAEAGAALQWLLDRALASRLSGFELAREVRNHWPTGGASKTRVYGPDGTWRYDR